MLKLNIAAVLITILFCIIGKLTTFIAIKKSEKEVKIAELFSDTIKLRNDFYELMRQNTFRDTPYIRKYIMLNLKLFLNDNKFNYDNIYPVYKKKTEMYFNTMLKEIETAPKEAKDILLQLICIIDNIVKLKRPVLYKVVSLKKMTTLKILDFLLLLCKWMMSILELYNQLKKKTDTSKINEYSNEYEYMKQVQLAKVAASH